MACLLGSWRGIGRAEVPLVEEVGGVDVAQRQGEDDVAQEAVGDFETCARSVHDDVEAEVVQIVKADGFCGVLVVDDLPLVWRSTCGRSVHNQQYGALRWCR